MAFTAEQLRDIKKMMDIHLQKIRPSEDIRPQLDSGWRIENQSVYLFDIRPQWNDPSIIHHYDYAKATWVQSQKHWKIFWLRANGKWEPYPILPELGNLQLFLLETENDPAGCFHG